MNGAWNIDTLADTDDVGFYKLVVGDQVGVYHVRWNRHRTSRYAHYIDVDSDVSPGRPTPVYVGREPFDYLAPEDDLTGGQVLHYLVQHGPWTACLFCGRVLHEAPHTTVGVGPSCAEKWLDASPRLLETIHNATSPRPQLFLICVDGRRVA